VEGNLEREMSKARDKRKQEGEAAAQKKRDEEEASAEQDLSKSKARADAEAKAKAESDEKDRRKGIRSRPDELSAAIDEAEASGAGKEELRDLKRQHADASRAVDELTDLEAEETWKNLDAERTRARRDLDGAESEVDGAEKALADAKASGDAGAMAEAAKQLADARDAHQKAEAAHRQADNDLALHEYGEIERMSAVTERAVANILSGEREEGFVVYDRYGNAQRYNPEPADKVFSYMMGLMGDEVQAHKSEEIDYRRSEYFGKGKGKGKGGGFDWDDEWDDDSADWGIQSKGKGGRKPSLKPTKSKKPRNPDGSSPQGLADDDYGPGEFWRTSGGMWAAKNPKGQYDTFVRAEEARAYAIPPARTAAARVAVRYLDRVAP